MAVEYFDAADTMDPELRAAAKITQLPRVVGAARNAMPHYAALLRDIDPRAITDLKALAQIPITRKSDLIAQQSAMRPFGGMNLPGRPARVFASPGPIHEAQADILDPWRFARALHATGLRWGDLLHNCFAYHFTPAGFMLDLGAQALGCSVFPGDTGNTEAQARAAAHLRPRAYSGTPEFLKFLLEAGDALSLDLSSFKLGHVTGGAFTPSLREWYAARGLSVLQSYGTAELGLIAYESEAREGLILDEGVLVEIIQVGWGTPLPDGEVGEVVVTLLDSRAPMVRFATGDLSAILPGISPCGRTNRRLRGWMGRADQSAKVRGLFVRPEQIWEALEGVGLNRARLIISRKDDRDEMLLKVEVPCTDSDSALEERLARELLTSTRLRGKVELVTWPDKLPNDGILIEDTRPVSA